MGNLEIYPIVVSPFQQNARIVACGKTRKAVVVDPGDDAPVIFKAAKDNNLAIEEIWLTHSHLDHCGGVRALQKLTGTPLVAHPGEKTLRANVRAICAMYGLTVTTMEDCPEPDRTISGGETLSVGTVSFAVLFTPGHSPGHLCFYSAAEGVLIAGDTLFAGSIGRTDLPGGDHEQLLRSIREEIFSLPDRTRVLPGHGPDTTVGEERESNPFLQS